MPEHSRPGTLLVIGWTFIIISILSLLSGTICLVVFFIFSKMPPSEARALSEGMAQADAISILVLNYAGLLAFVQIIPALAVLAISIFFLKLRAWARTGIEVICWAGIAYSILCMLTVCALRFGRTPGFTSLSGAAAALSVVLTIATAVPLIFIIKYLRRQDIRQLFMA